MQWYFFFVSTGKSDLTVDALKLHNDLQTGPLELSSGSRKDASMEEEEPNEAFSDRTSGTFLSGLSDCSNLTFRKVQRYWESNSAAHKEVGIAPSAMYSPQNLKLIIKIISNTNNARVMALFLSHSALM